MAQFIKVASTADIAPGEAKCVEVTGKKIALFNLEGSFYAIECFSKPQLEHLFFSDAHIRRRTSSHSRFRSRSLGNASTAPWSRQHRRPGRYEDSSRRRELSAD